MENKETHVGKMEKRLEQWGAKLVEFAAMGEGVGAEAKADYRKYIDDVSAQYKMVRAKLDELKATGGEEWLSLKNGVESAWKGLEVAYKKMTT